MIKKRAIFLLAFLLIFSAASAYALQIGGDSNVEIHGFITQGYLGSRDNNFFGETSDGGTFHFNERGINFASDVSDRLHIGVQFFSRDFGELGNNEVTIDWAYADYSIVEAFNLKAGKVKLIHGLYNSGRDVDMLRNSILLPQSVYNESWRDAANALNGLDTYGYLYAGGAGSFEYHLLGGVSNLKDDGAEVRLLEDQQAYWMDMDVKSADTEYTVAASVIWESPLDGLRLGVNGWIVDWDSPTEINKSPTEKEKIDTSFGVRLKTWATSVEYSIGNLIFAAEYNRINYDLSLPISSVSNSSIPDIAKNFDAEGYYGSLTYRFTDWFEVGTYYSEYYSDRSDKDGKERRAVWDASNGTGGGFPPGQEHRAYLKDLALAIRFDITENWIFKLEGHKMEGGAIMLNSDGNIGSYDTLTGKGSGPLYEEDWYLYAAKVSFSF